MKPQKPLGGGGLRNRVVSAAQPLHQAMTHAGLIPTVMKTPIIYTHNLKPRAGQGAQITFENSRYPSEKWNKPELGASLSPAKAVKRFFEIMATKPPQTPQDAARFAKGWLVESSVNNSFDSDFSEWVSSGSFWLRQTEGQNAHCWTNSRKNAAARWRNAKDSYSCAGFPSFYPETIEKFKEGMELIKPLLKFKSPKGDVTLSLARTLEGAVGACWGICTCETLIHVEVAGRQTIIPYTKAALTRTLKEILSKPS